VEENILLEKYLLYMLSDEYLSDKNISVGETKVMLAYFQHNQ